MSARPSDVSLDERLRRLLILGSTRIGWDGTTLPRVSIMGCPIKELDTSALSASPRRLTEGVLEVEGPTQPQQMQEIPPVYYLMLNPCSDRRLRDDLFDMIFFDGMARSAVFNSKGLDAGS